MQLGADPAILSSEERELALCTFKPQLVSAPPDAPSEHATPLAVFNNGSAGMPNFAGANGRFGLLTRVSDEPTPPADSLYGAWVGGLRYDALPVRYDHDAWMALFSSVWPAGSAAHLSYYDRLLNGPCGFSVRQAAREGVELSSSGPGFS